MMDHPTADVGNVSLDTLRTRLERDLRELDAVTELRSGGAHTGSVIFKTDDEISSRTLEVLARHGAILPNSQPTDDDWHNAIIPEN